MKLVEEVCADVLLNMYELKLKWTHFDLCLWVNKQLDFILPC